MKTEIEVNDYLNTNYKSYINSISIVSKDDCNNTPMIEDENIKMFNYDKGVIKKIGGQWLLCKKYLGKGYTQSKTYSYKTVFGLDKTNVSTYWTQKGRLKIHEILTSMDIKANCDKI